MGYSTDFTGTIKVTPKLPDERAIELNTFLAMRHHQGLRNNLSLKALDWLPDAHGIQDPVDAVTNIQKELKPGLSDTLASALLFGLDGSGARNVDEYNEPYAPGWTLWSDVRVCQDDDASYLVWNHCEKSSRMDFWLDMVVNTLKNLGHKCNGTMHAQGESEYDQWTYEVKNNVTSRLAGHVGSPTVNWELEGLFEGELYK